MLTLFAILWMLAMSMTILKRDRQLKQIVEKLKQYLHEQENQKTESQEREASEERGSDDDEGNTA